MDESDACDRASELKLKPRASEILEDTRDRRSTWIGLIYLDHTDHSENLRAWGNSRNPRFLILHTLRDLSVT
jgi:hypothetical protein